jgi:hypothetical protein
MSIVRMFLAAVFVVLAFIGVLFCLPLIARLPAPAVVVLLVLVFGGLVLLAMHLFDRRERPLPPVPIDESTLVSQRLQARRAFEVEEFEDEGMTFFIELIDGSVLFLQGQYLYEEEGRFPCTQFTVRRHPTEQWVYDVTCEGEFLEPEALAPSFSGHDHDSGRVPEDGQIITGRSYDELKAQWLDPIRPS